MFHDIFAIFSGHDTTASGVSWILYAMAGHPEYQQRAREEIDDVLEGRGDNAYLEWLGSFLYICLQHKIVQLCIVVLNHL